jgi:hypothetical protein
VKYCKDNPPHGNHEKRFKINLKAIPRKFVVIWQIVFSTPPGNGEADWRRGNRSIEEAGVEAALGFCLLCFDEPAWAIYSEILYINICNETSPKLLS